MTTATHFRTCHLCEAMCGLEVHVEGDRVTRINGDEKDPFSEGYLCPKATALADIHHDPDRLRVPLIKTKSGFKEISWEDAFDTAARRIKEVQQKHGRTAVAVYQGNPTVHNHATLLYMQGLMRALRCHNHYSATSLDQLPQMLAGFLMFGHQFLIPIPDVDRTQFFLVFGANPVVSNGSLMSAPGIKRRLKKLKARGGRLVVIDPRRSETAELADQHLPIRPGQDALLLGALVHTVFAEGLVDAARVAGQSEGLEEVRLALQDFTPAAVANTTGIPAEQIVRLARDFCAAPSAVCYGRVGVSTQVFGGLASWMINVLNAITGNLDRPGGSMFTRPAVDLVTLGEQLGMRGSFDRRRSRVRNLPEFGGEYPVATLADEIETPGKGQTKALITSAGNPVLSAPNGRRLDRAFESLEFMLSIDIYLNETTRHADLILPPTFALERGHYDVAFNLLAVRNVAKYSPAIFEKAPEHRHDYEIIAELTKRLLPVRSWKDKLTNPLLGQILGRTHPDRLLQLLVRTGPRGAGLNPFAAGLTFGEIKAAPHGLDLGPLEPALPERLYTKSRRVELAPEALLADLSRLKADLDSRPNDGLVLIGRRELRSNNSWMHNSERLIKGRDRCTLLMHPDDASARGLSDGGVVRVRSRVGDVQAPLEVSDEMMPGVVSLPHGWGHDREKIRLRVAETKPGVSVNDITDDQMIDTLTGVVCFSGVGVEVSAVTTETSQAKSREAVV